MGLPHCAKVKVLNMALFFLVHQLQSTFQRALLHVGVQVHQVTCQVTPRFLKVAPAGTELLASQPVQQNLAWGTHLQHPKDFGNLACLVLRGGIDKF